MFSQIAKNKDKSGHNIVSSIHKRNIQSGQPLQMKPRTVTVKWGITHLVKKMNGSIFGSGDFLEGEIGSAGELQQGQRLVIDDEKTFLSRRGPNQENLENRMQDKFSRPSHLWYHVLFLNDRNISSEKLYLREHTFADISTLASTSVIRTNPELVRLGVIDLASLKTWFLSHRDELNRAAMDFYEVAFQKSKKMMEEFGGVFGEENRTPANRKGWCGQTSNALLRYLRSKYPAIFALGKIVKGTEPKGGTHEYLIFDFAGGHVLVDPTFKQFDTKNEMCREHDILVATVETHPYQEYTQKISPAVLNLDEE